MARRPHATSNAAQDNLLTIPPNTGRRIIEAGAAITCPLLGTDSFIKFCKERGLSIDRERLLRLERLRLFAPVFRVRTPRRNVRPLSIPPQKNNNWFRRGWAWSTTGLNLSYQVPDLTDRSQQGYYSIFQVDDLAIVLTGITLQIELDFYLESSAHEDIAWQTRGARWLQFVRQRAESMRMHQHRPAVALLCQFISNRYYPHTQGDQRMIQVPHGHSSDQWIVVNAWDWDWYQVARQWKPRAAARLFNLTPAKLRHAYETMAITQAHADPLESWYQLTQFVSIHERQRLKGDALRAETLRSAAHMLRLLYKDLYDEELSHPNEVASTVFTPIPELEVRQDVRRYLEFVANRFGVNPQPKLALIVEGHSEEVAVTKIFEQYFGAHHGKLGIEIIVLGGVDAATGTKEDRFRAILRLIDYLHHHQTLTFLILDNERYARKLKAEARTAKSIHHGRRYVTRPEYIKVWRMSYEFENFSCAEIATAFNQMMKTRTRISAREVAACKRSPMPGACLKKLYRQKTGKDLGKIRLTEILIKRMLSPGSRRSINNRPIVKTLQRVARLAARNPLPTMQTVWEKNQASKYLGKKRRSKRHV